MLGNSVQSSANSLSLGYEPYDRRPRRLARSPMTMLTATNRRHASLASQSDSSVSIRPGASRAQIRTQLLATDLHFRGFERDTQQPVWSVTLP